jgi:hypothetical protein
MLDRYESSLVKLYRQGKSLSDIQAYLFKYVHIDVPRTTIYDWIKKKGGRKDNG